MCVVIRTHFRRRRSLKNGGKASNSLDYSNALVLKNVMHDKYPDRDSGKCFNISEKPTTH